MMRRICKRCSNGFEIEYSRGRPREFCFACLPQGCRWIGKDAARKAEAA